MLVYRFELVLSQFFLSFLGEKPIHFLNTLKQQVNIMPQLLGLLKTHIDTMLPKNPAKAVSIGQTNRG